MFRYIYKKVVPSGVERLVQDYPLSEVTLGRGGESHIVLPGQRVSPAHATFSWNGRELVVADRGALAGVRVNNRRVSQAVVRSGDTVTLGDVVIEISIESDRVELTASLSAEGQESDSQALEKGLSQLRVEGHLPPMRHVVVCVAVLACIAFGIYPLVAKDFSPWNSGPISNSHSLIAQDCQKCHAEPFARVNDRECLYCHTMSEHSKGIDQFSHRHPTLAKRCAECHMEHNGDHGLIVKNAEFCAGCHASMAQHNPDAQVLDVPDLAKHPQFRVSVDNGSGSKIRVRLDDAARAIDQTQIKLNHQIHLKPGLRGANGPVNLTCKSCHQPDAEYRNLRQISFDKHCRDCHSLGFDERLPNSQVPHGDSEAVYPALFTEYTKLLAGGSGGSSTKSIVEGASDGTRLFPGAKVEGTSVTTGKPIPLASVVQNAREAETQLFTRTGCFLCHSYTEKPRNEQTETNSHYVVTRPEIPMTWLPAARFSHGAHEEFSCDSCHQAARKSSKTADILLPKMQLCRECHAQNAPLGYVESGCSECHSFHETIGFPDEKKQTIADYLRTLTR